MFKFFRRIRQNLLVENRFSKYLLYAIGEIILVVIGILIALQINTWNEDRKAHIQEQKYLKSLQASLTQDSANFAGRVQELDSILAIIDTIQVKLQQPNDTTVWSTSLPALYLGTFRVSIETAVIEDLKSTGNLKLINNKALSDALLEYYKIIDSHNDALNASVQTYSREIFGPYLMKHYGIVFHGDGLYPKAIEANRLTTNDIRSDLFLLNALAYRQSIMRGVRGAYARSIDRATEILEILKTEIK